MVELMLEKIKEFFIGNNDLPTETNIKEVRKTKFLHVCSTVAIIIFFTYSYIHYFVDRHMIMSIADLTSAIVLICNLLLFSKFKKLEIAITVALIVCMGLFSITVIYGGFNQLGIIWILIFPILSYYLKGKRSGNIYIIVFMAIYASIIILDMFKILNTPYELSTFLYHLAAFIVIGIMAYFYEDTNNKYELIMKKQISTDPLTKLPNRTQLKDDIERLKNVKLILMNLDDFKAINDLYGTKAGDLTLIKTAKRLTSLLSEDKIHDIYKLHADEFAFLLKNVRRKKDIYNIIRLINRRISRDITVNNIEITLSATFGIADCKKDILADADIALKLAKEKRKHYVYFHRSMLMAEQFEQNIKWLKNLKKAIAGDNILPYYQPIINNNTGAIEKYECLMRLKDDDNKAISPYFFLEVAKKSKVYSYLTKIMVLKSFETFKNSKYMFSINLSLEDILNQDTVDFILGALKDYKISKRVVFEIVESERIEEDPKVNDFIDKVKELGCQIAIDDFGSGYSNFDYILQLRVDYIKIDASLIKNIDIDESSQIITETIVDFTKKLNIKTIAEFVHSKKVYEKVKDLKIDYSQGFYLGKPEPNIQ